MGAFAQAVLLLRRLTEATRVEQLSTHDAISLKTAYRYLHEALGVLAEGSRAYAGH